MLTWKIKILIPAERRYESKGKINGLYGSSGSGGKESMVKYQTRIREHRERLGLTQQTVADHLNVTRQTVSRWEGGVRYPDLLTAKRLADFLKVSLDDLVRCEETQEM